MEACSPSTPPWMPGCRAVGAARTQHPTFSILRASYKPGSVISVSTGSHVSAQTCEDEKLLSLTFLISL